MVERSVPEEGARSSAVDCREDASSCPHHQTGNQRLCGAVELEEHTGGISDVYSVQFTSVAWCLEAVT